LIHDVADARHAQARHFNQRLQMRLGGGERCDCGMFLLKRRIRPASGP
jgi:hypothetical protein